jgi:hypothetical protein
MDFSTLCKQIKEMDSDYPLSPAVQSPVESSEYSVDEELIQDQDIEECGDSVDNAPQSDVQMNVEMSGMGQPGIRQLIDILRDLDSEQTTITSPDDDELDDDAPLSIQSITSRGDDLHKSHTAFAPAAPGDNPMARKYTESLHRELAQLYEEICAR